VKGGKRRKRQLFSWMEKEVTKKIQGDFHEKIAITSLKMRRKSGFFSGEKKRMAAWGGGQGEGEPWGGRRMLLEEFPFACRGEELSLEEGLGGGNPSCEGGEGGGGGGKSEKGKKMQNYGP